ncbi:MAG: FHA domain-containing protein, partial [Rhodospirillaceae bacterium]|nr:FHA domain-containing protein [Rhodospirillaceae bacterium]
MVDLDRCVLTARVGGEERRFSGAELPVLIGGGPECDIRLQGISGSLQIGTLDGAYFVQPGRNTRGLRLDGELVTGSRWLRDGQTIALDTARAHCSFRGERLELSIEGQVTGGDTAPPDLEELALEM